MIPMSEVAKHNKDDDAWTVVHGKVRRPAAGIAIPSAPRLCRCFNLTTHPPVRRNHIGKNVQVLDITDFLPEHPGGKAILKQYAGKVRNALNSGSRTLRCGHMDALAAPAA
jgi:hypothetical protein